MKFIPHSILAALLFLQPALASHGRAATCHVGTIADLKARIAAAVPGDVIVVSNGYYVSDDAITITNVATAGRPIVIQSETIGGAEIRGACGFVLASPAAYIVIQGFKFTHARAIGIATGTRHCRLTRNVIELAIPPGSSGSYVRISDDDVEIDHNELRNKSTLGQMLDITGSDGQVARRLWVHHNYFHDFKKPGGNGAETIRWGLSGLSLSTGDGLCEYNLFVRCRGENEIISNKSSGNTYRYNTLLDSPGGEISQRHGNDCFYYGNYLRNTQGLRVCGDRHRIFSNYFESNSVGVNIANGDGDVYAGDPLTSHDRPDNNVVAFNTFIGNGTHFEMVRRAGGLGSSNTVVANNIFVGGGVVASIAHSSPYTGTWTNNLCWETAGTGDVPADGYRAVDPLLAPGAHGVRHLQADSPAIKSGRQAYDVYGAVLSFDFVACDLDGQPRKGGRDIGADQFSSAPVMAFLLTTNDVGPTSGLTVGTLSLRKSFSPYPKIKR
jgi:poly(beta-D-mannuronate) lyase